MIPNIKNILYTTGLGSGTPYVFRYALSLAQKYDAKIHIIHGHEQMPSAAQNMADLYVAKEKLAEIFEQSLLDAEKKIIDRLKLLCAKETSSDPQGLERVASVTIAKLPPKQAILEEAEKRNIDLIVMGSHRHSVLADAMLGTTTLKVLHRSTIPVMVVRIPENYQEEGF
ncbi:universal stress protein [Geopsychrobacter electrodiphilus]|uniref:universal stress protein n=1 Tax=Geopsychrobacter electrodiphilus TaxID=225196 RepID=UPI00037C65C6|nr:universal stress protein [Geopsychrobacter electrodiphilus]